ncbi:MAG: enoyl-CoA hydratase, partial [Rhodoblastus sp.]|nr:enoyl-CoA hydratase [Rhodoblastus sp.]
QAAEWGLVWKCVDDADLMEEAMAAAQKLAAGPPIATAAIKAQLESAWTADLASTLEREAVDQAEVFKTADLREGAAAFVEKRAPRFVGR